MPKLFPTFQDFLDLRDGTKIGVTRVIMKSTSDYVILPNAVSVSGHQVTGTNTVDFYLNTNGNNVTMDSGTAGDTWVITSLHRGWINYGDET